ncbi:MAG: hypothetical protein KGO82_11050 [Bacteroidota bacterium]|nr:hypothetical protein [Bacteroidota bacterium]
MKRTLSSVSRQLYCILCLFSLADLCQCKQPTEKKEDYANVKVNPAFIANPPVATKVNVTEIANTENGGNLLIEATMPKERIKENVLAVLVDDSAKVVLHDDGKNGDKTANDGVFSTVMNTSTDSLREFVASQAIVSRKLLEEQKGRVFKFQGRLELPADPETMKSLQSLARLTDKANINLKERVSFINAATLHLFLPVPAAFKQRSLTVTDLSVVNDPTRTFNPCTNTGNPSGAWTFGTLMTDMAATSGIAPVDFVKKWLETWLVSQTVNSDVIAARANMNNIFSTWQTLSGGPGAQLDIKKAPFKLVAIVNRFDLRTGGGAYGGGTAGEGRFVFAATGANCGALLPGFLVIFEYGVNKRSCADIHAYAKEWVDLASLPFPSASYNDALQHITDQFAKAGTDPSKPNGSSLNQLRTNEVSLSSPWELREFNIDPASHILVNVSTKREPQMTFNGALPVSLGIPTPANVIELGKFVNDPANMRDIINDKKDLPASIATSIPFIAGKAHDPDPFGPGNVASFHWDAVSTPGTGHIDNDTARFHISLNTCSGCHGGETQTVFKQIDPATSPATLSRFLTGDPAFSGNPFLVSDRANRPAGSPIQWPFNDLENRGRLLIDFNATSCLPRLRFPLLVNQRVPVGVPVELIKRLTFNPITMTD